MGAAAAPELTAVCGELAGPCISIRGTKYPKPQLRRPRTSLGEAASREARRVAFRPLSTSQSSLLRVVSAYCWAHPAVPPRSCLGSDDGSGVGSSVATDVGTNVVVRWILCSRTCITPGGMGQGGQPCPAQWPPHLLGCRNKFGVSPTLDIALSGPLSPATLTNTPPLLSFITRVS